MDETQTPHIEKDARRQAKRTDFEQEMSEGHEFWLGPIICAHEIGEYQFIEYRELDFSAGKYHQPTGKSGFSCYINGKRTAHSYNSLDAALVGTIAYKVDGCNSRAGEYFMKMIEPESVPGSGA